MNVSAITMYDTSVKGKQKTYTASTNLFFVRKGVVKYEDKDNSNGSIFVEINYKDKTLSVKFIRYLTGYPLTKEEKEELSQALFHIATKHHGIQVDNVIFNFIEKGGHLY